MLVDAAGTAHLAWSEDPNDAPGIMHYCRFPRGSSRCAATYARAILQPAGGGNGPATDVDYDGPIPMSVGNELLLLDSRCCNNANAPDGGPTIGSPVYLFTSEDGGGSFTGPDDPNGTAGIIGTQDPSGGALVFNGNSPMIGTISDTQTGGTMFQGVPAGQFTREKANLSTRSDQSDAYDGRLAVDGIRPVAVFDDLEGTTVVREWNGQGSVNDPANWSILRIANAFGPRIVGGASGLLLLSHTSLTGGTLQVRSISRGAGAAGPATNLGSASGSFDVISESANGQAAVARTAGDGVTATVEVHTSPDGRHWRDLGAVTRVPKGELNRPRDRRQRGRRRLCHLPGQQRLPRPTPRPDRDRTVRTGHLDPPARAGARAWAVRTAGRRYERLRCLHEGALRCDRRALQGGLLPP